MVRVRIREHEEPQHVQQEQEQQRQQPRPNESPTRLVFIEHMLTMTTIMSGMRGRGSRHDDDNCSEVSSTTSGYTSGRG